MKYGYACINTELNSSNPRVYTNRSMIRKTFDTHGIEYVSKLALQNISDLFKIIKWNQSQGISFYRMSSDMFPWMSEYELENLTDFDKIKTILSNIGLFVKLNNHRITFHPGPFNVLASPKVNVVINAVREIDKHSQIMNLMNLDRSPFAKINIHIGGVYKDKNESLKRWCYNFNLLSESSKKRLTIENDDKPNCYTVEDLLFVHEQTGIPIVIDYHHVCNSNNLPLKDAAKLAFSTWPSHINPVIHVSQSRLNHNKRAHSDYVTDKFETFNHEVDVMFEAKMKEQALFQYLSIHK